MENLHLLPVPPDVQKSVGDMADRFRGYTGISIDILSVTDDSIRVRVEQKENRNGYILTQSELVSRAAAVLSPLENRFRIQWVPLTYRPDFDEINSEWLQDRMRAFNLKAKDLVKQLAIDESTISLLLNGKRGLTKFQKAAFYYYFLTYELNRDLRAEG